LKFREFLYHNIPMREIIVGHYRGLHALQRAGERVGVVVRHGWEHLYWREVSPYNGDKSFPSSFEGNQRSVPTGYRELYVVNCGVTDPRITALPKGVPNNSKPWRLVLARAGRPKADLAYCNFALGAPGMTRYTERREAVYRTLKDRDWITFENMGNRHGVYDISKATGLTATGPGRRSISARSRSSSGARKWNTFPISLSCSPTIMEN
jgi:hypothetical protein